MKVKLLATTLWMTMSSTAIAESQADDANHGPLTQRKAGYEDRGVSMGSPNTPSRILVEEDVRTEPLIRFPEIDQSLQNWWDLKSEIDQRHGLRFGIDYTAYYQHLSKSLTEEDYAEGGENGHPARKPKKRKRFSQPLNQRKPDTEPIPNPMGSGGGEQSCKSKKRNGFCRTELRTFPES